MKTKTLCAACTCDSARIICTDQDPAETLQAYGLTAPGSSERVWLPKSQISVFIKPKTDRFRSPVLWFFKIPKWLSRREDCYALIEAYEVDGAPV